MATVRKDIFTRARPADAWDAVRDIGALHTRLVPGFVIDTKLEPGARVVTFANGMVLREPIVTIDEAAMRLVWTAEGGRTTHYNGSAQVFAEPDGTARVVWTVDFLPDSLTGALDGMMSAGATAMKTALDRLRVDD
jgi:Polyketide cyclase / dehydrase and lipid transport